MQRAGEGWAGWLEFILQGVGSHRRFLTRGLMQSKLCLRGTALVEVCGLKLQRRKTGA